MTDREPQSTRTCVGTRTQHAREELLGWFRGEDGTPWPDWTGRMGRHVGRGAWVLPNAEAIRAAVRRNGFASGFREPLSTFDADLLLTRAIAAGERAWLDRLGLANRAGALAVGQAAAQERLGTGGVSILLLAQDAGASRSKFGYTGRVRGILTLMLESGTTLGAALGREFVSVVAVERGVFADDLGRWARWLAGLGSTLVLAMPETEPATGPEQPGTRNG